MSDNSYLLAKQGSEIDSILANATADHNKIGVAGGIAPLGADGKVPAANLPDNDATLRFSAVKRVPGATITDGTATGSFEVVWLDNSALPTSYTYSPPTAEEKEVQGRFVAKTGSGIYLTEASGGVVSTTTYYANWAGRDAFCNSAGKPLKKRLYLCTATGRQYDKFPGNNSTGLRCIAAPPMDAKKALFNDLWNEACRDLTNPNNPFGYYDADVDDYPLNGLRLSYAEAIEVYYAGTPRKYDATNFYGGWNKIRTNLPPRADASNSITVRQMYIGASNIEVANIGAQASNGQNMFYANIKLRKAIGKLMPPSGNTTNPSLYMTCPIEEIHLGWWAASVGHFDLRNLPNLNADSLQWMVTNAQVTTQGTRQVTLHADAYACLTDDMKALAAEKSITFVCAS